MIICFIELVCGQRHRSEVAKLLGTSINNPVLWSIWSCYRRFSIFPINETMFEIEPKKGSGNIIFQQAPLMYLGLRLNQRSQTLKSDQAKWSNLTRITLVGSFLGGNTHEFEKDEVSIASRVAMAMVKVRTSMFATGCYCDGYYPITNLLPPWQRRLCFW